MIQFDSSRPLQRSDAKDRMELIGSSRILKSLKGHINYVAAVPSLRLSLVTLPFAFIC